MSGHDSRDDGRRSAPTRVLFDGRALSDPHSRTRGFGVFSWSLLTELGARDDVAIRALVQRGAPVPRGIESVPVHRFSEHRFSALEHEMRLAFDIARRRAGVFHSPALEPPVRCTVPWVQTLHDLTPLLFDDPSFTAERDRWRRVFSRMGRADTIVAVSSFSAGAATRLLDIDPARIVVIPNGVDGKFRPAKPRREPETPYVLSVGVYGPHKGYQDAFRVIDELARRGYPHRLKVVGALTPWRQDQIAGLLASIPHADRVDIVGFADDDQLLRLYQDAGALIMTSRSEGFGLPVIEAMACGTPVVAFDNTSLPEVVGDGGILVHDGDAVAVADALAAIIDDPGRRDELAGRGIAHAREFDWSVVAALYAEIYRNTAARRS